MHGASYNDLEYVDVFITFNPKTAVSHGCLYSLEGMELLATIQFLTLKVDVYIFIYVAATFIELSDKFVYNKLTWTHSFAL